MKHAVPGAVCVEVRRVRGSAPREAGARMLVSPEGTQGSIGGGNLEFTAAVRAAALLRSWRENPARVAELSEIHALGPALGQCCGGSVTLSYQPWFEAALPAPAPLFHLQLHGAGHVGRALVEALRRLPCTIDWIDARADAFPAMPEDAGPARIARRRMKAPEDAVANAPKGSLFLVMTHSHALDWSICDAILRRDFRFAGLIGSATKRARFESRWRAAGIPPAAIARLACPIGLPGITGKQPEIIALSVAAQLLEVAGREAADTARRDHGAEPASCAGCAAMPVCDHS